MDFKRTGEIKETLSIGDKEAQYAGRIGEEARRLGLIKIPTGEPWNLFPDDDSFEDIAQWAHPEDNKSGILFCRYVEFEKKEERERGAAEYHVLFINQRGNSEWDEHQGDFEEAIELLNKSLSWKDLGRWIER